MRRRLGALLILCIAVPSIALAADTDPKKQITPADQAKARSVLLKRTDFAAGWRRVPSTPSPDSNLDCPGFDPDSSDLTLSGEAEADFEYSQGGLPSVGSIAEVFVTKTDALASWSRTIKPALARCLAHVIRREGGGKVTIASQGRIAFPKVAPRTAAFRVVARVTVELPEQEPQKVPFTLHLLVLGHGRGDVAILSIGVGNGLPVAELRKLARRTASRLAAAKL